MKLVIAFAVFVVGFGFAMLVAETAELDGTTCVGESGEKGKTEADKDELVFANGTFHSKGCDPYGFKPAPYTATREGDTVKFQTTIKSEKEGEIQWNGTVQGETCEAQFVWTKTGQKPIEYWYKGTAKKSN